MTTSTHDPLETPATVVRNAERDDASAIGELLKVLGYTSPAAHIERRIEECAASADTVVFVAELDRRVVGAISFHRIPLFHAEGSLGRITSLVVASDFRQRGIGRLLVAAAEKFAWAHGCIRIEVTSGDHRLDAHSFYEHLGYALDCRRFIKQGRKSNKDT